MSRSFHTHVCCTHANCLQYQRIVKHPSDDFLEDRCPKNTDGSHTYVPYKCGCCNTDMLCKHKILKPECIPCEGNARCKHGRRKHLFLSACNHPMEVPSKVFGCNLCSDMYVADRNRRMSNKLVFNLEECKHCCYTRKCDDCGNESDALFAVSTTAEYCYECNV